MCGILALLLESSEPYKCFNLLLRGLRALQNRGYDSCGIMDSNFKSVLRAVKGSELNGDINKNLPDDAIDQVELRREEFPEDACVGITHTRWATHGGKTEKNAHPHVSSDGQVSVIHNGVIENCVELREMLVEKGCVFSSETDTEIICNWVANRITEGGYHVLTSRLLMEIILESQSVLQGSWSVAILHKDFPDSVFLAKSGSPLLIGCNDSGGILMATSEIAGFVNRADSYAVVEDGDVIELCKGMDKSTIMQMYPNLEFTEVPKERIKLTPDPYPTWMSKEIYDQSSAVEGPAEWGAYSDHKIGDIPELKAVLDLRQTLPESFDILLVGCGTSYHAGLSGRWFFRTVPFHTVRVVVASEFTDQDLPKSKNGPPRNVLAILVSQSGETKDVHRALSIIKKAEIPTIALVNTPNSMISRDSDVSVFLHAGREVAVASTKAYVSQIIGLNLIALALQEGANATIPEDWKVLSTQVRHVLEKYFPCSERLGTNFVFRENKSIQKIAEALSDKGNGFVLSTGTLRATGYEAALKIKEISRIWIQGYPTGALKHGPFALIEKGTPVIFALQDGNSSVRKRTETAIEEVYARKARVFVITDIGDYRNRHAEEIIHVPRNKTLASILTIIPFQILSYQLSLMRGLDPDKPVHLAKVVTTD